MKISFLNSYANPEVTMKLNVNSHRPWPGQRHRWLLTCPLAMLLWPAQAQASMFQGEALDTMADVLSWAVLVIAPVVGIAVFWLVHILPEKKQHPQAKAIQTLCLLSLVFGGLLWPIAWLWAYSKPVLYKMAYGTDKVAHGHEDEAHPEADKNEARELEQMRRRVTELEAKLAGGSVTREGQA